jgi:hypothetical protein
MAKKSAGAAGPKVNKAALVREYRSKNPNAKPKEIVEALAALDPPVKINANYVATVRYHEQGKNRKGGDITVDVLIKAHNLANELGGLEKVRPALSISKQFVESDFAGGDVARAEQILEQLAAFTTATAATPPASTATAE